MALARTTVREARALLKAAGVRPSKAKTDISTLDELGEAFQGNSVADLIVKFVETEDESRRAES